MMSAAPTHPMPHNPRRMPALFISHGAPDIAIKPSPAHEFLKGFGARLPRPKAILIASAHWETAEPAVALEPNPKTIYDFGGFDRRLYSMTYKAPAALDVARRALELLAASGLKAHGATGTGYDHGVWTPLCLMYPNADIPVAQVAIQPQLTPAHHLKLGQALRPLRDEGVLVIGSGAISHNLRAFFTARPAPGAGDAAWVTQFTQWMCDTLQAHAVDDLINYRALAPHAVENHPQDEHLLPIFVSLGAAHDDEPIRRVHESVDQGVLAMDCYQFGE